MIMLNFILITWYVLFSYKGLTVLGDGQEPPSENERNVLLFGFFFSFFLWLYYTMFFLL